MKIRYLYESLTEANKQKVIDYMIKLDEDAYDDIEDIQSDFVVQTHMKYYDMFDKIDELLSELELDVSELTNNKKFKTLQLYLNKCSNSALKSAQEKKQVNDKVKTMRGKK